MKKRADNIYVAIVRTKSAFSAFPLLGRALSEYAERGVEGLACAVIDDESEVVYPTKYAYLAVIYDDMPLVTAKSLITASELMDKKGLKKVALGRGYLSSSHGLGDALTEVGLNFADFLSVNDTRTLKLVYNELRERIIGRALDGGAIILGENSVIDDTAILRAGAVIEGDSRIVGCSEICAGARIRDSRIEDSKVCENATVGPYAYVRMNSVVGEGARIGDFVEIKKSTLGAGVKCAHLSYIGDAEVGDKTNIGCGTVFCNYDGVHKHKTVIGKGAFIGANTNLVAPLTVGDGAFIAAGTTVTEDLENNTFCIGRVRQTVKERRK